MTFSGDCPCGSGRAYDTCCGPAIEGSIPAKTAEALMRSRYTAYVLGKIDYVKETLSPRLQKDFDYEAAKNWSESAAWTGLTVHSTVQGQEQDTTGEVEFSAQFEINGTPQTHHEHGYFERLEGNWVYTKGNVIGTTFHRESPKVGRNDPCPCGSGKKYKKCCGR